MGLMDTSSAVSYVNSVDRNNQEKTGGARALCGLCAQHTCAQTAVATQDGVRALAEHSQGPGISS